MTSCTGLCNTAPGKSLGTRLTLRNAEKVDEIVAAIARRIKKILLSATLATRTKIAI